MRGEGEGGGERGGEEGGEGEVKREGGREMMLVCPTDPDRCRLRKNRSVYGGVLSPTTSGWTT